MAKILAYPLFNASNNGLIGMRILEINNENARLVTHTIHAYTGKLRSVVMRFDNDESSLISDIENDFRIDMEAAKKCMPSHYTWKELLSDYKELLRTPKHEFMTI